MGITSGHDLDALIRPDEVHGSLYTDPDIYARELERIWYRTWVFVGHVSEVPEPNDYVVKSIGPQPVIMSRDKQGRIHLLLNRCTHRANLVCDAAKGNSSAFRCPSRVDVRQRRPAARIPVQQRLRRHRIEGRARARPRAARRHLPGIRVRLLRAGRPVAD